jgi:hypothetical protein
MAKSNEGLLTESEVNIIRGMNLVGHAKKPEVDKLLDHIQALEDIFDDLDNEDAFGTQGWRYMFGLDEN